MKKLLCCLLFSSAVYAAEGNFYLESGVLKLDNNIVVNAPQNLKSIARLNNDLYVLNFAGVYKLESGNFELVNAGSYKGLTAACNKYLVAYGANLSYFTADKWHEIHNVYIYNHATSTNNCDTYLSNGVNLSVIDADDFSLKNVSTNIKNITNLSSKNNVVYIYTPSNIYSYKDGSFSLYK